MRATSYEDSDQNLRYPPEEALGPWLPIERLADVPIWFVICLNVLGMVKPAAIHHFMVLSIEL